ncbi:Smr domain-containing protein [Marivirga sericea]|uniref:Smr domain-containing protein n=1 Tax=Marivirga sericea TaxID=1028 RepID=A0A1X7KEP3_9BACT|nr:Smr/MutS family protein [Marivirga sericea]SMG38905.1 Smr domain-containing protein [Marivirga sericea]
MQIGDRVRLMKGTEEGIVVKMLDKSLVEVEIEDGFAIPVLESELVVVSSDESTAFDTPNYESQKPSKQKTVYEKPNQLKGFHLAIIPLNDHLNSIYFLNPSSEDVLLMANEVNGKNEEKTILSEKIFAEKFTKITERNMDHLNTWAPLSFTILTENSKWSIPMRPEKIIVKIKSKHFQKEKGEIPFLNKKGYLIALNQSHKETVEPEKIDIDKLRDSFFTSKEETKDYRNTKKGTAKTPEIDLHIETIDPYYENLPKEDILRIQLSKFEEKLNEAFVAGLDEIIFIHGVGNGVLRDNIHKQLSQHHNIQFFKDTHKEKFGYGATLVKIK